MNDFQEVNEYYYGGNEAELDIPPVGELIPLDPREWSGFDQEDPLTFRVTSEAPAWPEISWWLLLVLGYVGYKVFKKR
jgi:hypothetical protein